MAVFIEGINVVVRRSAIAGLYPGGISRFGADAPNRTFCADDQIARVGFMSMDDAMRYVAHLVGLGFTHHAAAACIDLCLASEHRGIEAGANWLVGAQHADRYAYVWLAGTDCGVIAAPEGIDLRQYTQRLRYLTPSEMTEFLTLVAEDDNVRTYVDRRDEKKYYVGRTASVDTEATEQRCRALRRQLHDIDAKLQATRRTQDQAQFQQLQAQATAWLDEAEAIADQLVPASIYLCGFANRVLQRWDRAESWLRRFATLQPFDVGVWLELTWCLAMLGRFEDSLHAAQRAYQIEPMSAASLGNLAAAQMALKQYARAEKTIDQALKIAPCDSKNQLLSKVIQQRKNASA